MAREDFIPLLLVGALFCAGCGGRFVTRTEYLAPGFSQASLRGRTVAVLPPPDGAAGDYPGELAGVARGIRDAGARVRVLPPPEPERDASPRMANRAATGGISSAATQVTLLADFADPTSDAPRRAAWRWGRGIDATYLLVVRVTDAAVIHEYTPPGDAGAAVRRTGRQVGLRLALIGLRDGATAWVASGSGEAWVRGLPGAAAGALAATVDDDLRAGNLSLYPPAPPAQSIAAALTRRLLARVPSPVEVEPN